jgi:hypothetical protein
MQVYRQSLLAELSSIKKDIEFKTVFINPNNFINRYIVTDYNAYIYAANTSEKLYGISERPFTTFATQSLDKFPQFFHVSERMFLADQFLSNPDSYTYESLLKFRIDYFILPKQADKKYDYRKATFFLNSMDKRIVLETKKYFVYKN